jgi:hypothetical protein
MANRGYLGKPLYVSEYGVLMPDWVAPGFPPERVNQFMNRTFDYLLTATDPALGDPADGYRIVQRVAWFSTTTTDFNGYLFQRDQPTTPYYLSPMGQNWVSYTHGITVESDLYPVQIRFDPPALLAGRGNVNITVKARLANSGNTLDKQPVTVRFYDGDPNQGGHQIGADQSTTLAGCGETAELSVVWPNVAPGDHRVFVWADPANAVGETNEANNLQSAVPFFATQQVFLPLVSRTPFIQ